MTLKKLASSIWLLTNTNTFFGIIPSSICHDGFEWPCSQAPWLLLSTVTFNFSGHHVLISHQWQVKRWASQWGMHLNSQNNQLHSVMLQVANASCQINDTLWLQRSNILSLSWQYVPISNGVGIVETERWSKKSRAHWTNRRQKPYQIYLGPVPWWHQWSWFLGHWMRDLVHSQICCQFQDWFLCNKRRSKRCWCMSRRSGTDGPQ